MKKIILALLCISCLSQELLSQEKLPIDTSKSTIKWFGEYTFFFNGHEGNILFKEGYFIKTNEKITGGEFIIDMNSITNSDIKVKDSNKGLVDHLKDADFFDVKKYPIAKLTIIKVEYSEVEPMRIFAKLTLKGITKPISFFATPNYQEKNLKTKFKIDRTLWNVSYKSKFKDGAISDAIGFEVNIKF